MYSVQMGNTGQAVTALEALARLPGFQPGTLTVLVKDALHTCGLPIARAVVCQLFELCHAESGCTAPVDASQLFVSTGDLLRTLVQLHALPKNSEGIAIEQLEQCIGQPCDWQHLHLEDGKEELEKAGMLHGL
jgi:hypothetical protein